MMRLLIAAFMLLVPTMASADDGPPRCEMVCIKWETQETPEGTKQVCVEERIKCRCREGCSVAPRD